jgi:tetratricopeptide (TPR) repeat protein
MHWLSECSKSWLLVLDNADDPEMDLSQFFPAGGNGHILITTRNPGAKIHNTVGYLQFRGMDPEEAITLLLKLAYPEQEPQFPTPQNRELAQGIASELGYLALALTHAGATIRQNIFTLERYLHYYLGHRKTMISSPWVKGAADANIISTWEIPFTRIVKSQSVEHRDAVDLIHVFAFMHFESIPESIFQRSSDEIKKSKPSLPVFPAIFQVESIWSEDAQARLRRALRVLCDHSIIEYEPERRFCSLHPVIHRWARDRLTETQQKEWLSCTTSILAHSISSDLETSGRNFRRLLLPHIESCLCVLKAQYPSFPESIEQATEMEKFALVYSENGLWRQARSLQRKVVEFKAKNVGKQHQDTIQSQRSLANMYWNLFELRPALEIQRQILSAQWWSRPSISFWTIWPPWKPDHIPYCLALDDLTRTLWLAGMRDLSKRTGERAMDGLVKHLGPEDPLTLNAMFNLARTYLHLDDLKKSQELLVWVLRKRKRFFGPDHPDTLMTRNELGMNLCAQKKNLAAAERLVVNVLESRKRILGEEHAYTLWSVNDLSKIYCERGRWNEAVKLLEDIIPIVKRTLGEEHVGMIMTKSNLSRAYILCRKWKEAEELIRPLLEIVPPEHPDWIHTTFGYVHVLIHQDKLEEAERRCNTMLDKISHTKILALDSARTLAIVEQLWKIYHAQGREDDIVVLKERFPTLGENRDRSTIDVVPLRRATGLSTT